MNIVCNDDEIIIRLLEKDSNDIECLYNWLNKEEVYKYYGDANNRDFNYVRKKYEEKIFDENTFPCIIECNKISIGYVQFYIINYVNYDIEKELFDKIISKDEVVFAIDIFIADSINRNKGIGSRVIKLLVNTLFSIYDADSILIDPKVNNKRAINCYKKCGFKECFIVKEREEQNGIKYDNLIMKIKK